jgi:hypothetical protein
LLKIASQEAIELIARSILEMDAYITYMLEENITDRLLSYQVAYANEKLRKYRKLDMNTKDGAAFSKIWKDDEFLKRIPFPNISHSTLGEPLYDMLSREPFLRINSEYMRTKAQNKKVYWYSLWGGPRNIEALFTHIKKQGLYEILYRTWSSTVHQSASFSNIVNMGSYGGVSYLRNPKEIFQLARNCLNIILDTYNYIIMKLLPDYTAIFASFYISEIRDSAFRIDSIELRYE